MEDTNLDLIAKQANLGNRNAKERLLQETFHIVKPIFLSIHDQHEREDVTQEFMLRLTRKLELYRIEVQHYRTWVRAVARHFRIEHFRRTQRVRLLSLTYCPDMDTVLAPDRQEYDVASILIPLSSLLKPREFLAVIGQCLSPPVPDHLLAIWFGKTLEAVRTWRMRGKRRIAQQDPRTRSIGQRQAVSLPEARKVLRIAHQEFLEHLALLWLCGDQWSAGEFGEYLAEIREASIDPLQIAPEWNTQAALTISKGHVMAWYRWNLEDRCLSTAGDARFFTADLVQWVRKRRRLVPDSNEDPCVCALCCTMYAEED